MGRQVRPRTPSRLATPVLDNIFELVEIKGGGGSIVGFLMPRASRGRFFLETRRNSYLGPERPIFALKKFSAILLVSQRL